MGACTVVVTGASGSVYGMRLIEQLVLAGHEVSAVFTEAGREVTAFELGFDLPCRRREGGGCLARRPSWNCRAAERLRIAYPEDLFDRIASGSHRS